MSESLPLKAKHMREAIRLATKGIGRTNPNPPVGAVVVREGVVVGRGYHHKAGEEHAEILALREAGDKAQGATLYVTLEPCSTWGKTPPCTDAIVHARIARVCYGAVDPTPNNGNKAVALLGSAGIDIEQGLLAEECAELLRPFTSHVHKKRPFVTMKVALSLDGRIACTNGHSQWITGTPARTWAHRLRKHMDAIVVGQSTFLKDNPRLTARSGKRTVHVPIRIVLWSNGIFPRDAALLHEQPHKVWLLVPNESCVSDTIRQKGVRVFVITGSREDKLRFLMEECYRHHVMSLLVEGGSQTYSAFWDAGYVDKVVAFIAPKILGDGLSFLVSKKHVAQTIKEAMVLKNIKTSRLGEDLLMQGDVLCSQD